MRYVQRVRLRCQFHLHTYFIVSTERRGGWNGGRISLKRTVALSRSRCSSRLSSYAIRIPRGPRYAVIIRRFTESSSEWRRRWEDFVKSFAHEIGPLSFSLRTLFFHSGSARSQFRHVLLPRELLRVSLPFAKKKVNLRLYQRIAKACRIEEREVIVSANVEMGSTRVLLTLKYMYLLRREENRN